MFRTKTNERTKMSIFFDYRELVCEFFSQGREMIPQKLPGTKLDFSLKFFKT